MPDLRECLWKCSLTISCRYRKSNHCERRDKRVIIMYRTLNRGDIEELLQSLTYSKKNISEQKIDPNAPKELRDDQRAMRDAHLARIEALGTKLRFLRDATEPDEGEI